MLHFICFAHLNFLYIYMNIRSFQILYFDGMTFDQVTIIPKRHESLDSYLYNTQRFIM